jgi:hypothetical protein
MIIDDNLYLGGPKDLHLFKVTAPPSQPISLESVITTEDKVSKILRLGNEILLA